MSFIKLIQLIDWVFLLCKGLLLILLDYSAYVNIAQFSNENPANFGLAHVCFGKIPYYNILNNDLIFHPIRLIAVDTSFSCSSDVLCACCQSHYNAEERCEQG